MLKESEAILIQDMAKEIVSRNDQLTELILNQEALREEPIVGEIFGHPFKAKADLLSQDIIVDLKTTSAKTIEEFVWLGKNKYFYDTQAFIYQTLFNKSMTFVAIDKARKEAERKEIEANGIAKFQQIVNRTITPQLLRWKGVEATQEISKSPNAKVIVIGNGDGDLPIILGGQ